MNADLKFDYHAELKRVNLSQSSIDLLRDKANNCELLPKSLTDKQVNICEIIWGPSNQINQKNNSINSIFQLLLFLSKCNGDIDKSIKFMQRHYEIKRKAPQLFKNRDVMTPELQQALDNQYFARLPQTEQDKIVCYHGLTNPIPNNYHYNNSTTCFLMMIGEYFIDKKT